MKTRLRSAGIGAALIAIALTASASPAIAAEPTQESYQKQVAEFAATHPEPRISARAGEVSFRQQMTNLYAYWRTVPWDAVYGAQGYSVASVRVERQLSQDGVERPVVVAVLTGTGAAQLTSSATELSAATSTATVTPFGSASGKTYNGTATLSNFNSVLTGTWKNDVNYTKSVDLRVGSPNGSACSVISRLGSSGFVSVPAGATVVASTGGINVNSLWGLGLTTSSGSVYYGTYCAWV